MDAPAIFGVLMGVTCHEAGHRATLYALLRLDGVDSARRDDFASGSMLPISAFARVPDLDSKASRHGRPALHM
jgi:hypothetical protein